MRRFLLIAFLVIGCADAQDSGDPRDQLVTRPSSSNDSADLSIDIATIEYRGPTFLLRIPEGAQVDSTGGNFPDANVFFRDFSFCPNGCDLAIAIVPSSSGGLTQFLDSIATPSSPEPEALDYAPSLLDSISVAGRNARWVEHWCGDCEWRALYVEGDGVIGVIAYNIDSRDRSEARTNTLKGLIQTFRWLQ